MWQVLYQKDLSNFTSTTIEEAVFDKLDSYMQKNEIRSLPNAIHKDKLNMD